MSDSFPSHIFKAYDIRGIYPSELNEDLSYRIGRAFTQLLQKELNKKNLSLVVSSDMRISSPQLKEQLIQGIIDQGSDVIEIGLSSSPTFYFAVANYGYDGGIIVSASHNPKEYNGFKMVRKKAIPLSGETGMDELRELVKKNDFTDEEKGNLIKKDNVLLDQLNHDLSFVNVEKIKPFKIVADPSNAMGAQYLEVLFSKIPGILIKMNFDLDGTFPAHQADPLVKKNVEELQKRVLYENADLGIATDGDGDRVFFVDNKGENIPPHIMRSILAKIFLEEKPGSTICYDIRPGKITQDIISQYGGNPVITRVGHSLIKEKMREVDAYFAGESSGHFFLRFDHGVYEAPMVIIGKLLEELSKSDLSLSELVQPYNKYFHSGEVNSKVSNKEEKMKEIVSKNSDAIKIDYLDGITIEYDDYWFNIRPSNTEPLLRLNLEAISMELMEEKRDALIKIIRS